MYIKHRNNNKKFPNRAQMSSNRNLMGLKPSRQQRAEIREHLYTNCPKTKQPQLHPTDHQLTLPKVALARICQVSELVQSRRGPFSCLEETVKLVRLLEKLAVRTPCTTRRRCTGGMRESKNESKKAADILQKKYKNRKNRITSNQKRYSNVENCGKIRAIKLRNKNNTFIEWVNRKSTSTK